MAQQPPVISAPALIKSIRERLEQAAAVAKAAEACAVAGNPEQAVRIVMDVEQLTYEASTLLNAASLINRQEDA